MKPLPQTPEEIQRWKKKLMAKSGTFLAICVLNICILLLLGGTVIYHLVSAQQAEPIASYKIKAVPPPPKPPAKGGDSAKSLADPTVTVVPPPVSLPSLVVSSTSVSFNIKASAIPQLSSALPSLAVPTGSGFGQGTTGGGSPQSSPFGGDVGSSPALVGYFYDLKQTRDNPPKPSGVSTKSWKTEMDRLVADNLNESDLDKYLRSSDQRSTNGLGIPEQSSINAPSAFGLGGKVKPNLWAIIYHGKASVPESGRYRFVGFGDDLLYVKLNGKVVFDGGWLPLTKDESLHETYPFEWSASLKKASSVMKGSTKYNGRLRKGAWFDVSQGDLVQLDVLIGDWGGECGYFLLLEKEGAKYEMAPDNLTPKLPLFQVGAKLPLPPAGQEAPPVSDSDVVWPSVSDM